MYMNIGYECNEIEVFRKEVKYECYWEDNDERQKEK